MKKYIRVLLLAALVCSLLAGCSIETKSSKDSQDESKYHLYYLNESETVLREEPYSPGEETADFMVKDLMQKLGSKDAPDGEISLLPEDVSINSYEVQKDLLVIDFNKEYSKMSKIREKIRSEVRDNREGRSGDGAEGRRRLEISARPDDDELRPQAGGRLPGDHFSADRRY